MQYKRELEKEKEELEKVTDEGAAAEITDSNGDVMAGIAKVETLKNNKKEKSLDYLSLRGYCENLFEFKNVTIRKFK